MSEQSKPYTPFYWMTEPGITPQDHNAKEFVDPSQIPWTDWLMPGTYFKLLYCDVANGFFTILMKVDPGTLATVHWHLGTAQAYILEGGFHYHENDKGDTQNAYTCEVGGSVHQPFAPEGSVMLGIMHGPIAGYHEGKLVVVADAKLHLELAKQNNATKYTTVVGYTQLPAAE